MTDQRLEYIKELGNLEAYDMAEVINELIAEVERLREVNFNYYANRDFYIAQNDRLRKALVDVAALALEHHTRGLNE